MKPLSLAVLALALTVSPDLGQAPVFNYKLGVVS